MDIDTLRITAAPGKIHARVIFHIRIIPFAFKCLNGLSAIEVENMDVNPAILGLLRSILDHF